MTASKIDWSLSPAERELLRRDCEASKVPIAVEDSKRDQADRRVDHEGGWSPCRRLTRIWGRP
jgi:hypothetical protein